MRNSPVAGVKSIGPAAAAGLAPVAAASVVPAIKPLQLLLAPLRGWNAIAFRLRAPAP